jgi:hypothetical protein
MPSDRPIFIVGCPRSGTTLLQLMLHAHPRIAIPPETRFLLPVYEARRGFGDLREPGNRRELARWIVEAKETRFQDLGLDPSGVMAEIAGGPPTVGSALGIVFRAYARRFGRSRWGDKRPSYFRRLDVLMRMFPDAQIVHLIRDGRDCVASLNEMPWFNLDTFHAVSTWAEAVDAGRRAAQRLGRDAYYELRYEGLVSDPHVELRGLCAFLGEDYDPAMAEPHHMAKLAVPAHKKWHARTYGSVDADRVGSWVGRLEPWEVSLCESVIGSRLTANGYELTGAPRASAAILARYLRVTTRRRLGVRKRAAVDLVRRCREPNPVAATLTTPGARRRLTPAASEAR